ncbi:MAG TPA: Na+/H+ antiporter NhaA [Paenalcaligenes hominis]|uniref:Na(+)/H(+) antiporter NhaA n=1 Tax=Paenalcaligenes hominis TaxID=643674 RepID=A0A9D3ABZ7_9BURK|nr:Na+/H+ antiporter NhaA [Paenalcaligenes hominis]NJB65808.1 NhaA family Na+:H+ antiporter [Paenalcaligenes hominis]GGE69904.1 Na(+)/H(+) antiporter NhaA [Paenalcaligenes hominis]HJH24724.1 Na+/H+ antiporter NhaA [Paenalcaligenes hominis]
MKNNTSPSQLPFGHRLAQSVSDQFTRLTHIEAFGGIVLIAAAVAALVWANSSYAQQYFDFWEQTVGFELGDFAMSGSLHFWVNDALMTAFFLVVGMEIRREIHEGALSSFAQASLPLVAAAGGVIVPALIYLMMNTDPVQGRGWAVPTATDIAFAVGVLALLGRSIPSNVRIMLLAIAIIDDVVAVLIIAFFYSGGLDYSGLWLIAAGMLLVVVWQRLGIASAFAYLIPGAILWFGVLKMGAHPTLAGVILGLMTPVYARPLRADPLTVVEENIARIKAQAHYSDKDELVILQSIEKVREAHRELLPPVARVQMQLHPWVAFLVMPVFALANAGVSFKGLEVSSGAAQSVMWGVILALVIGKPLGIFIACRLAVALKACQLAEGVTWSGILLIGLLAGIGFTMSIFIGTLAFDNESLLNAAKLGVLVASSSAALLGLGWGAWYVHRLNK